MTNENYFKIDKKGIIIRYTGCDRDIAIPSKIHGIPVREIGNDAFCMVHLNWSPPNPCYALNVFFKDEIRVTIPEGVTRIGYNAFYEASLTEIIIPKSVIKVGTGAFTANPRLKKIIVSEKGVIEKVEGEAPHIFFYNPLTPSTERGLPKIIEKIAGAIGQIDLFYDRNGQIVKKMVAARDPKSGGALYI